MQGTGVHINKRNEVFCACKEPNCADSLASLTRPDDHAPCICSYRTVRYCVHLDTGQVRLKRPWSHLQSHVYLLDCWLVSFTVDLSVSECVAMMHLSCDSAVISSVACCVVMVALCVCGQVCRAFRFHPCPLCTD